MARSWLFFCKFAVACGIERDLNAMPPLMIMNFSLNLPLISIIMIAAASAALTALVLLYYLRLRPISKARRHCDKEAAEADSAPTDSGAAGVSVIVYSQDEAHELAELLPQILSQDYDGKMEVIVVNDGESLDVRDTIGLLQLSHSNLYLTHTPDGARNLSRKKLGITLGVKAARYDVVVLTTAAARITSDRWLRCITRHFADSSIEVVLGYAHPAADGDIKVGKRHRSFDFVADSALWLSAALTGKPYRGSENNLAYRRSTFFANKGFARSLNLCFGDDDIFVSEIARHDNTAVELSAPSMVTLPADNRHNHHEQAIRRRFTEKFIKRRRRLLLPLSFWLAPIAVCAAAIAIACDYSNATTVIAGAVAALAAVIISGGIWRQMMGLLRGRRLLLSLPLLAATRPCRQAMIAVRSKVSHQKRYTWD